MTDKLVEFDAGPNKGTTAVVLPCAPEQFSEFIASLLGRPQELGGKRAGAFVVDKNEALQLYHLVTQRVEQQHGARPLQFTARIRFDNGTSVLLNTVEDFKEYNEVRAVRSVGLLLSFTYVLGFPGAASPEKQEIDFGYLAEFHDENDEPYEYISRGFVHYRIRHTARTWGADIESLFSHYIDNLVKPESSIRAALRKNASLVGSALGGTLFAVVLLGFWSVSVSVGHQHDQLLSPALLDGVSVADKLDRVIRFLLTRRESVQGVYTLILLLGGVSGSVLLGVWASTKLAKFPPSAVVLTKRASDAYAVRIALYERSLWKLAGSAILAFAVSIAANFFYDYMVSKASVNVMMSK